MIAMWRDTPSTRSLGSLSTGRRIPVLLNTILIFGNKTRLHIYGFREHLPRSGRSDFARWSKGERDMSQLCEKS